MLIHWKEGGITPFKFFASEEGHALLAYDYQRIGTGLNVDVVDPNAPMSSSPQYEAYESCRCT